ncbi:MAG TPA: CRTAC1 family protein [Pyrinomonadaceae bacterium]
MKPVTQFVRKHIARLVAVIIVVAFYLLAQQPSLSTAERNALASNFRFHRSSLYEVPTSSYRSHRVVNPSLERIASWVSATGASVALNDLDGDGLSNDLCTVDPRTDRVTVAPAPGAPMRYQPFVLDAGGLFDATVMAPMGCLPGDVNEDGLMDIVVTYWGRTPIVFLAKKRDGKIRLALSNDSYKPQEIIPGGERWFTGAATLADLDGDGHLDIVIGNYYKDGARILDAHDQTRQEMQHSMSRAYNAGQSRLLLWQNATAGNEPSVQFKEVKDYVEGSPEQKEMITHGWTLAVGAADLDGDLLPELYFANDFGPDRLLHNRSHPGDLRFAALDGTKTLTTPNSKVVGRDSFKGMGVDFADLNGDGIPDILVSNIADSFALEESNLVFLSTGATQRMKTGAAPYIDRSEALGLSRSGWGWDIKVADFNNDGISEVLQATGFIKGEKNRWPELQELATGNDQLLSNPNNWPRFQPGDGLSSQDHNPFFVRAADGRFYDLAAELGLDQDQVSRGIAVADVNGDGLLDYAVANQWGESFFYLNESPHQGAFLGIRLRLALDNSSLAPTRVCSVRQGLDLPSRSAVGALVKTRLPDGRWLVTQVDGGNGHSGKRSSDVHFGLGSASPGVPLPVEIAWRNGRGAVQRQTFQLTPGWHTVILGQPERISNECQPME